VLRHDPSHPHDPQRDRFILSKGHGVPACPHCTRRWRKPAICRWKN
jgi:transketolase